MIGENSGTKSAKMRPAKIEQTVDLQKWFNNSMSDSREVVVHQVRRSENAIRCILVLII